MVRIHSRKTDKDNQAEGHLKKKEESSVLISPEKALLGLQQVAGNQAISQLVQSVRGALTTIRARLTIGYAGDRYEREANTVAERVTRREPAPQSPDRSAERQERGTPGGGLNQYLPESDHGQSLDPALRDRLEAHLGHDLSRVRVHNGEDAEAITTALGARAVTSGQDIWLGKDESPQDLGVMAHELTHVVQQQGDGRERGASAASAPQVQLLRVQPNGQFAKALEEFTNKWNIPDRAIRLLRQSPTFRRMVRILNRRYAYWNDPRRTAYLHSEQDGVITEGPFRGRRIIEVLQGSAKAYFSSFGDPDNKLSFDVIVITGHTVEEFIQEIAHEASHAVELVTGQHPSPTTIRAEVNQAIQEEQHVRGQERQVVREIRRRGGRDITLPTSPTNTWAIERDFPRIGEKRTYLEQAFFGATLRRALAHQNVDVQQVEQQVNGLLANVNQGDIDSFLRDPDNFWLNIIVPSKYGRLLYLRGIVHRSWTAFLRQHPPGSQDFENLKEQKLQEHARALQQIGQAFFGETIAYTPRPGVMGTSRGRTSTTQRRRSFWERFQ